MFNFSTDFQDGIDKLEDFYDLQHFYFGCIFELRAHIRYPIVKEMYTKVAGGLGSRSLFQRTPIWRNYRAFDRKELRQEQYLILELLHDMIEYQEIDLLKRMSWRKTNRLWQFLGKDKINGIWKDTVDLKTINRYKYPIEIRRFGWEIRQQQRYNEIPILGDLCEDMSDYKSSFLEEAEHFRDPSCLHTYACRYLHNICKGM